MNDTGYALESLAMRSFEAATGTRTTTPACSISTTIGLTTTTTMSASADPTLQHLDAGHTATEGSILVESIPQEPAKARRKAKPKTAAVPTGAVVEGGKEQCDCLNFCGDDNRIKGGKVKPCEAMAEKIHKREVLIYDGQQLVYAQVEVNRALFLMNNQDNTDVRKNLSPDSLDRKAVLRHIKQAIKNLQKACYE